jgi:NAD(P)-dependent dehydrogenase (short-subunit alcohol dehydrogenase family)
MAWRSSAIPDLRGRTMVVTGGNTGIGYATAVALAQHGASVIIGCRSAPRAEAALAALRQQQPDADVGYLPLDLSSLASVHEFAEQLLRREPRLDVLINNAGIMMVPTRVMTAGGFELQFATNVLGHFALTGLLLEKLAAGGTGRVVTVSSLAHWHGRLDLDNLDGAKTYHPTGNYAQSKLANLLLAYELDRRLKRDKLPVLSIGVHPGVTHSELGRHSKWTALVMRLYGQSSAQGALPSLMAAVDPGVEGGDYIGPGGFLTFKGPPKKQGSSRASHDAALGAALWQRAEAMTGVRYL